MTPQLRTIDLPPLSFRADVASVNAEDRTVELVWTTGAGAERMDWATGKRYIEKLSTDPKHVRLDRLNAGAPLLDAHSGWSVRNILGAVVPSSVRMEKSKGFAKVRISKRADVEPYFQDVVDGIIRFISTGYRVHKFEEDASRENRLPTRTAVDWEPFELSFVPMPIDIGAKVRGEKNADMNSCVIVTRNEGLSREDADRMRRLRLAMARR